MTEGDKEKQVMTEGDKMKNYTREDTREIAHNAAMLARYMDMELIYDIVKDDVGGFVGVDAELADAAIEFYAVWSEGERDGDWMEAITVYASHVEDYIREQGMFPGDDLYRDMASTAIAE